MNRIARTHLVFFSGEFLLSELSKNSTQIVRILVNSGPDSSITLLTAFQSFHEGVVLLFGLIFLNIGLIFTI